MSGDYTHYYDTSRPGEYIDDKPRSPYGTSSDDIRSGVRKTLNTCQYWVQGLPGVCTHWQPGDPGKCSFDKTDNETKLKIIPSGYGTGQCDLLGRRYECDQYEASNEDLEQYVCVATCPHRSGLWKRETDNDPWRPVKSSEIRGHNADSDFVGRCDGCGFGRGQDGWDYSGNGEDCSNEEFVKLPVVCNYYRPYHLAFGAKKPRTTSLTKGVTTTTRGPDGQWVGDEREEYEERLPFSFRIYNVRAKLQKCAYWDADESGNFVYETAGLHLESGDLCSNPDEATTPYHTESVANPPPTESILENVWAEAGGVICNGCRTDCPGYTGKWIYCVDELMDKGDRISAQQILELRFWMNDWESKEEYDSVFKRPPNRTDPDTSDIYTYGRWATLSEKPVDSVLMGKRCSLCVPNVRNEFSKDLIQVEEVKYIAKGTSAPNNSEHQFPSLIRDVEEWAYPPLNIVYPYAEKDPFDEDKNENPCSEINDEDIVPCVKRYHSIEGDAVSVIGWCVRNVDVYVFNAQTLKEESVTIPSIIKDNTGSLAIQKEEDVIKLDEEMNDLIEELTKKGIIYKSSADANGLFAVGPVDITYQKINELYVAYEYGGTWYFRKRKVWSQWHGGVIVQSTFNHDYAGDNAYIDDGYHSFTPDAEATAKMFPLHGTNRYACRTQSAGSFGALRQFVWSSRTSYGYNYTYCIKKKTVTNKKITKWKRVDNAGTLWLEIDDMNLNYIFQWQVTNIKVECEKSDGTKEVVEMRGLYPGGAHQKNNMPPNACVITPADSSVKKGFFESAGWEIKLDYWYLFISNDDDESEGVEVVFPPLDDPLVRFSGPSYQLTTTNSTITASQIYQNTVAVCGKFTDEDGRLVCVFATKLMMDVARVLCRDVEIVYGWSAKGTRIEVRPMQGFLRRMKDGPFYKMLAGQAGAGSTPPCGDHEISPFGGQGPMWFPYDSCDNYFFYDIWTGANSVVKPVEGCPREGDMRMMGPIISTPWCEPHSTLWDCAEDWGCGFDKIKTQSTLFTGYALKRGRVSAEIYAGFGWELPKFGNVLRDQVERWRSIDNISHISLKGQEPVPSVAWAPMVMDNSCFFNDFNCIDGYYLSYANQMNFLQCSTLVGESIPSEDDRHDFDSLFGLRRMAYASYPEPFIEDKSINRPYVAYYYFKDDSVMWAWQERWKNIEVESGELAMVNWEKPEYIFDKDKMEHRFIISEGVHTVQFKAPQFDESECKLTKWPSMKLGSGKERYFKCVYSEYNSSQVEWEDENEGEVGGSGGGSEPSIYEKTTTNSNWIHSKDDLYPGLNNMLYDSEATKEVQEAKDAEREIVVSYDRLLDETSSYVYNRGLIANIYRSALKYMPYEESVLSEGNDYDIFYDPQPDIDIPAATASWLDAYTVEINITFKKECTPCVSKVEITGYKGNHIVDGGKITLSQPNISIYENDDSDTIASSRATRQTQSEREAGVGTDPWTKELKLPINPTRMLGSNPPAKAKRTQSLRIELQSADVISFRGITIYGATYVDGADRIKVYERKYLVSTGSHGNWNPDGEQRIIGYEQNNDNSGVYFFDNNISSDQGQGWNKMKSIICSEDREDEEEFDYDIKREGQVHKAESEQEILYTEARNLDKGKVTTFKTIVPPNLREFFSEVGASSGTLVGQTCRLTSELRKWMNVPGTDSYEKQRLWYPKGYEYDWADYHKLTKCYLIDEIHRIAQLKFIEMSTGETKAAATGLQSYYTLRSWHMLQKQEKDLMVGGDSAAAANSPNWGGALDMMCNDRSRG